MATQSSGELRLREAQDRLRRFAASTPGPAPVVPNPGASVFELRDDEQPFPDLPVTLAGWGNEHLVYRPHDLPGVVVKLAWRTARRLTQELGVEAGPRWQDGSIGDAIRRPTEFEAARLDDRLAALRSSFGDGHSVPEPGGVIDFEFPGRVLRELGFHEQLDPAQRYRLPVVLTLQHALDVRRGRDLAMGMPAQPEQVPLDVAVRAGQKWMDQIDPGFDPELFTRLHPGNSVADFVRAAGDDPDLADCARRFLDSARRHTAEHQEFFSVRGRGNLYFAQQDGRWEFHLVDALGPTRQYRCPDSVIRSLTRVRDGDELSRADRESLHHEVSQTQGLNALAQALQVDPYLELPPSLRPFPWETYAAAVLTSSPAQERRRPDLSTAAARTWRRSDRRSGPQR